MDAAPLSHEDVAEDQRAARTIVGIVSADRVMDVVVADDDTAERPVEPGVEGPRVGRVVGTAVDLIVLVHVVVATVEEGITRSVVDQVIGHVTADDTLVPLGVVDEAGRVDGGRVLRLEDAVVVQVVVDDVVARVFQGQALAGVAVHDDTSLAEIVQVVALDPASRSLKDDPVAAEILKEASRHQDPVRLRENHPFTEGALEGESQECHVRGPVDRDQRLVELGDHDVGRGQRCRRPEVELGIIEIDAPLARVTDLLGEIDRAPLLLTRAERGRLAVILAPDPSGDRRRKGDRAGVRVDRGDLDRGILPADAPLPLQPDPVGGIPAGRLILAVLEGAGGCGLCVSDDQSLLHRHVPFCWPA